MQPLSRFRLARITLATAEGGAQVVLFGSEEMEGSSVGKRGRGLRRFDKVNHPRQVLVGDGL